MPEIIIESVSKSYGDHEVLRSVDLKVGDGEFVTLLGPSGCGKTTILRCIAGLETPTSGRIGIDGRAVADPSTATFVPPERRGLGMVFQSYALWPHLTVAGNIAYPMRLRRRSRKDISAHVAELLDMVGLSGLEGRSVAQLSGGQQQRVALARALAGGAELVLYDEPLSNLDAGLRVSMRQQIRAVHDRLGTTSLFVTHDQEEALAVSDRIVVFSGGHIVQDGTPHEVYSAPVNDFVARFLGFENVLAIESSTEGEDGARQVVLTGGLTLTLPAGKFDGHTGLAVKALHVRVGSEVKPGDGPVFTGRVTKAQYLGATTDLHIDAHGTDIQAVRLNHVTKEDEPPPHEGEHVPVQFPYDQLAMLAQPTR